MPDVFISYSRRDSADALELAERLRSHGVGVWIDQHGIGAASSWSSEIVQAIDDSKALLLLLSRDSTTSDNVIRELTLAFEAGKRIVPIELEAVSLPVQFRYPLAGIQRTSIGDFGAIVDALSGLGIAVQPTPTVSATNGDTPIRHHTGHGSHRLRRRDDRKALIVLPFQDLSPSNDNRWFAEGLTGELIDALSHVKSLRVLDRVTSISLSRVSQTVAELGELFDTRYIVEGSVRKFGEEIKISRSLLDLETQEHLWQHSQRGAFKDVFDIQEHVAENVVTALKLHLTSEEQQRMKKRGTQSNEAYELFLRAISYFDRRTREGLHHALNLLTEALTVDPEYARAMYSKAQTLADLYRSYDRNPDLLDNAESLSRRSLELDPSSYIVYGNLTYVAWLRGNVEQAEALAKQYIEVAPKYYLSHFWLAFIYGQTQRPELAIEEYRKTIDLDPDELVSYFNVFVAYSQLKDEAQVRRWAQRSLPAYQKHLRLMPDDEIASVRYAVLLKEAGRENEARLALERLLAAPKLDPMSFYTAACLYGEMGDHSDAITMLRRSVEEGFADLRVIESFHTEHPWIDTDPQFRSEFEGVISQIRNPEVEKISA